MAKQLPKYSLKQFEIKNFRGIISIPSEGEKIIELPHQANWIFLTGENGYGKTSLLQAITLGLCGENGIEGFGKILENKTEINIEVNHLTRQKEVNKRPLKSDKKDGVISRGENIPFVAYGPVRIPSDEPLSERNKSNVKSIFLNKSDLLLSIEELLLDLSKEEEQDVSSLKSQYTDLREYIEKPDRLGRGELRGWEEFHSWSITTFTGKFIANHKISLSKNFPKRDDLITKLKEEYNKELKRLEEEKSEYQLVKEFLIDLMDNIKDIKVENKEVVYFEKEEPEVPKNKFQLASGNKMLLSLVGDILIRLSQKQRGRWYPYEIEGIVIIDELDLHLHPKWQRKLPGILSKHLPKVQFIASTHSPIPLLGAPEGSVFLKVNRTEEAGITVDRLLKLERDIKYLQPNALLTSPIFDVEDIASVQPHREDDFETNSDYQSIQRQKEIDEELKDLDPDIFPDTLFD